MMIIHIFKSVQSEFLSIMLSRHQIGLLKKFEVYTTRSQCINNSLKSTSSTWTTVGGTSSQSEGELNDSSPLDMKHIFYKIFLSTFINDIDDISNSVANHINY